MESAEQEFTHWKVKFFSSFIAFYKKQDHFKEGFKILENVMSIPVHSITDLAINSIQHICAALELNVPSIRSSELELSPEISKENLIIDICKKYKCDIYINPPGGVKIYNQAMFTPHGIKLLFLQPDLQEYPVKNREFIPGLSILDVIMCCGTQYARKYLFSKYGLLDAE